MNSGSAKQSSRWEDAVRLKIEPEEIAYLVHEMARQHRLNGGTDFYTAIPILMNRYRGQDKIADRIYCITIRMRCLAELMRDERMHGWRMEASDPEGTLTNAAVFSAVALCSVRTEDERCYFDPGEFFRIAGQVEPEGMLSIV
jgi:hypothetical protein